MRRLEVRGYCAPNAVGHCKRSAAAHAQVLQMYGIENITSAKSGWWHNDNTFVLLLEDAATRQPLGGVRLQRWGNGAPLPFERAIGSLDARVHTWVASFAGAGVGELCGLWCSPDIKGFGMGRVLTMMGLSLTSQVETDTLFALCDSKKVPDNTAFGFAPDPTLGFEGTFEYPRPGLLAQVLRTTHARQLFGATPENRGTIHAYRDHPVGTEILSRGPERIQLARDLRLLPLSGRPQSQRVLTGRRSRWSALEPTDGVQANQG